MTLIAHNDPHREALRRDKPRLAELPEQQHIRTRKRALSRAMFDPYERARSVSVEGKLRLREGVSVPATIDVHGRQIRMSHTDDASRIMDWSFELTGQWLSDLFDDHIDHVVEGLRAQPWAQGVSVTSVRSVHDTVVGRIGHVGRALLAIYEGAAVGVQTYASRKESPEEARVAVQQLLRDALDLPHLQLSDGRMFDYRDQWWFDIETFEVEGDGAVPDEWFAEMQQAGCIPKKFDEDRLEDARRAARALKTATVTRTPRRKGQGAISEVHERFVIEFTEPVTRLDGSGVERLVFNTASSEDLPEPLTLSELAMFKHMPTVCDQFLVHYRPADGFALDHEMWLRALAVMLLLGDGGTGTPSFQEKAIQAFILEALRAN